MTKNTSFKFYSKLTYKINQPEMKYFTVGKIYQCNIIMSSSNFINSYKIMNDKKEWVEINKNIFVGFIAQLTTAKLIKNLIFFDKGDELKVILSCDKKTFRFLGSIYDTKKYLNISQ